MQTHRPTRIAILALFPHHNYPKPQPELPHRKDRRLPDFQPLNYANPPKHRPEPEQHKVTAPPRQAGIAGQDGHFGDCVILMSK